MSYKFTTIPKKTLYQSILSTSTTFKMSDITGFDGADLTAADFGTVAYGVLLNSDKSVMELFSFDPATIASSSISFVYRGLKFDGDLTTEVTANKLDWVSGSTILIGTDTPQVLQWLKEYIDGIAIAGSPDMNTTTKGIAEEATQAEVDAGTATGGTSARLAVNPSTVRAKKYHDYAADSVGTDSYAITVSPAITAYATGQEFTFKAGTANTGAATLNVCSLGAKDIKKDVSVALATGDILANQIVKVIYDGTNFQIVKSLPGIPVSTTYDYAASPVTWTKSNGLKYIDVQLWGGGGSGGASNGANPSGGGGGGSYNTKRIIASDLGATETITIGAGGTAIPAGTASYGVAGGNSTFGSLLTAYGGGAGGSKLSSAGGGGGAGVGGVGAGGTNNAAGAGGGPVGGGANSSSVYGGGGGAASGGSAGASVYGGGGGGANAIVGGDSYYGGGGGGGSDTSAVNGGTSVFGGAGGKGGDDSPTPTAGAVPGGGGGGATAANVASGAGGAGRCIVIEYY